MAKIVVIGGSFGGLTVALHLKKKLKNKHKVTVVSDNERFVFMPSLPWLALGMSITGCRNTKTSMLPVWQWGSCLRKQRPSQPVFQKQGV